MGLIEPLHPSEAEAPRSAGEIVNSILENGELPLFVMEHGQNKSAYVNPDIIAYHYDVSANHAKKARDLLVAHTPDSEIKEAADAEWVDREQ